MTISLTNMETENPGGRFKKTKKKPDNSKRSRLIIRNLSFDAKEDDLRKLFSPHGTIVDVNIPRKDGDGCERKKSKGFAFLSFDNVKSSLLAIKHINGKKFMGRPIAVDFAVAKSIYQQMEKPKTEEPEKDNDNDEDDPDEAEDDDDDEDIEIDGRKKKSRGKINSDVTEGKTLFIRNMDLETDISSLTELFESYGPLDYCKICYDPYSGQSKGSAFVKFKNAEDAKKCREEATEQPANLKFHLDGQQLVVSEALSRGEVEQLRESKNRKHKDRRNLYLAKEGLIYPDSPAAKGVSPADLKKRLALEEKKHRLLRNLHYFISDNRLCIHNLPPNIDDVKLRKMFQSAAGNDAKIIWAKVMRNREKTQNGKFGRSKGFGFVEFQEHRHALKALRYLNNNPTVFTEDRRPIVEFSVENKVALNRKKYRAMKQKKLQQEQQEDSRPKKITENYESKEEGYPSTGYSGIEAKPFENGEQVRRRKSNKKLIEQKKKLKERKRKLKSAAKTQEQRAAASDAPSIKKQQKTKTEKKKLTEADDFETNYLRRKKRKMADVSVDQPKNIDGEQKRKWYLSS